MWNELKSLPRGDLALLCAFVGFGVGIMTPLTLIVLFGGAL